MRETAQEMETQLRLWSVQIGRLEAKTQKAGDAAGFEDHLYIDELKALYAISRSKIDEFKNGSAGDRGGLGAEMKNALDELEVAINNPKP